MDKSYLKNHINPINQNIENLKESLNTQLKTLKQEN